jgi:cytochrome c556
MSEPLLHEPEPAPGRAAAPWRVRERLLREILDQQRRLGRLLERRDPADASRIDACRREIRMRRAQLRDLPHG